MKCLSVLLPYRIADSVLSDFVGLYWNIFWRTSVGSVVPRMLSAAVSVVCGLLSYMQVSVMSGDVPEYSVVMVVRNVASWMWVLSLVLGLGNHLLVRGVAGGLVELLLVVDLVAGVVDVSSLTSGDCGMIPTGRVNGGGSGSW
jgi:hypothetical protein